MYIIYQTGVFAYYLLILIVSAFNTKAKLWIDGRRSQKELFKSPLPTGKRIWFHFASLGEFEQGRVLLEKIKNEYKEFNIIISFFSPSGYEVRKNYALAEKVYYLPIDTKQNAIEFLNHINPEFIFFNKYEYWHHYIKEAQKRGIPLFINSAIFRSNQIYFKWYGGFYRNILKSVKHFFLQNEKSAELLANININNFTICGDTRFDRVFENSINPKTDYIVEQFCKDQNVIIAGSTWLKDEELIKELSNNLKELKLILVPHELSKAHLDSIRTLFKNKLNFYTDCLKENSIPSENVLVIDTIGLLSSIYKHGKYCYIGGGFGAGIHNTLEAATYGKPIFFGPNYEKFSEAKELIKLGAAFSIHHSSELLNKVQHFEKNSADYDIACHKSKEFVLRNKGASDRIIAYLKESKILI